MSEITQPTFHVVKPETVDIVAEEKKVIQARKEKAHPIHLQMHSSLFKEMKIQIAKEGKSMKDYIFGLIEKDLAKNKKKEEKQNEQQV